MTEDRTRFTTPAGSPDAAATPRTPEGPSNLACAGGDTTGPRNAPENHPLLADDCWFLSWPTASGKSALAPSLARRLEAEIISVDSMAVYRGLDVGTAKPSADDRRSIPHHLIDVVPASEPYSVARWLADAAAAVADCRTRGRHILFVGGTPLYLRALRDGLAEVPGEDPAVRRALAAEAEAHGTAPLHARLAAIDPEAAARIHPNDAKRIIRALEVAQATGRPLSTAFAPRPQPLLESRMLIVDLPRRTLYERIDRRVERMFADGIVEETRAALDAPGGIGPTARQAAGYAEAIELLAGTIDLGEAINRTQQRTRQLAKRQLTWLRSFAGATWIAA